MRPFDDSPPFDSEALAGEHLSAEDAAHLHRLADDLVNELFDGGLGEEDRRKRLKAARQNPSLAREIAETSAAVRALRQPVACPDVSERVLDEVERRRGFMPTRLRRVAVTSRWAAAAGLALLVGAGAVARHVNPDIFRVVPPDRPVSQFEQAVATEMASADGGLIELMLADGLSRAARPAASGDARQTVPVADAPGGARSVIEARLESPRLGFITDADSTAVAQALRVPSNGDRFLVAGSGSEGLGASSEPASFRFVVSGSGDTPSVVTVNAEFGGASDGWSFAVLPRAAEDRGLASPLAYTARRVTTLRLVAGPDGSITIVASGPEGAGASAGAGAEGEADASRPAAQTPPVAQRRY